jgi:hypothetical protein
LIKGSSATFRVVKVYIYINQKVVAAANGLKVKVKAGIAMIKNTSIL